MKTSVLNQPSNIQKLHHEFPELVTMLNERAPFWTSTIQQMSVTDFKAYLEILQAQLPNLRPAPPPRISGRSLQYLKHYIALINYPAPSIEHQMA